MLPSFDIDCIKVKITPFGDYLGKPKTFEVLDIAACGLIYVNGLYVCEDSSLVKSYNFSPDILTLNRDRNIVSDIEDTLSKAYAEKRDAEAIFNLIELGAKEVSYVDFYMDKTLMVEIKQLFENKYGSKNIVEQGSSLSGVSMGYHPYRIYKSCGISAAKPEPDPNTPFNVLSRFAHENKKFMRRDERNEFSKILAESKKWRCHDVY
jgi:hypothetical protein